jgi:Ala-tRNA(Pro) deacylase
MSIRTFLYEQQVPFATLLHRPAWSAARRAQSIHVPGGQVAKGILIRADSGYVLAVLPATHRVDLGQLGRILGARDVRLATEEELEQVFSDCERGASPPFGRLYGLKTVVDASLAAGAEIVVEGNTRQEGIRLRYRDYEAVEAPIRARFAVPIAPRRRPSHSKAG